MAYVLMATILILPVIPIFDRLTISRHSGSIINHLRGRIHTSELIDDSDRCHQFASLLPPASLSDLAFSGLAEGATNSLEPIPDDDPSIGLRSK